MALCIYVVFGWYVHAGYVCVFFLLYLFLYLDYPSPLVFYMYSDVSHSSVVVNIRP